jgi:hypothetical protein
MLKEDSSNSRFSKCWGCKESSSYLPIAPLSKLGQANPIWFIRLLSSILNDPGQTAHPVLKYVLDEVRNERLSHSCNLLSDLIIWLQLPILHDFLQRTKGWKGTWINVLPIEWVQRSERWWNCISIALGYEADFFTVKRCSFHIFSTIIYTCLGLFAHWWNAGINISSEVSVTLYDTASKSSSERWGSACWSTLFT